MASAVDYVIVCIVGGLVGLTELIARYRDAPGRAAKTPAAVVYVALNALASGVALMTIRVFDWDFGQADGAKRLLQVLIAGLAAMAIFRSALFVVRVGARDVDIGPSSVLQVLLGATDRTIDRNRAAERSREVSSIMDGVVFSKAFDALPTYCLALMQNVSAQEQTDLAAQIRALQGGAMDDTIRSLSLGLALVSVVGADVLRTAVTALGDRLR